MTTDLCGLQIFGSKYIRTGKIKAICHISAMRIVIPEEIMKKDSEEIVTWLNSLAREEYLLLP